MPSSLHMSKMIQVLDQKIPREFFDNFINFILRYVSSNCFRRGQYLASFRSALRSRLVPKPTVNSII